MNNENNSSVPVTGQSKVGRPKITIVWPEGEFTVDSLHSSTGLSKVTIYQKVDEDLKSQLIEECGKQKSNGGRPRRIYKRRLIPVSSGTSTSSSVVV